MTVPPAERIRSTLQKALSTAEVEVRDDSGRHAGHVGARDGGGHFFVHVESEVFTGRSRLERHRLVYEALADMLPREIHALTIEAISPEDDSPSRTP